MRASVGLVLALELVSTILALPAPRVVFKDLAPRKVHIKGSDLLMDIARLKPIVAPSLQYRKSRPALRRESNQRCRADHFL